MNEQIRLEYDDDTIAMLDKINRALETRGLKLVDDGEVHDGYILLTLVEVSR